MKTFAKITFIFVTFFSAVSCSDSLTGNVNTIPSNIELPNYDDVALTQNNMGISYMTIGAMHNECMDSVKEAGITDCEIEPYLYGYLTRRGIVGTTPSEVLQFNNLSIDVRGMRTGIDSIHEINVRCPDEFRPYFFKMVNAINNDSFSYTSVVNKLNAIVNIANADDCLSEIDKYCIISAASIVNASYAYNHDEIVQSGLADSYSSAWINGFSINWNRVFDGVVKDLWGAVDGLVAGYLTGSYAPAAATGTLPEVMGINALVGGVLGSAKP